MTPIRFVPCCLALAAHLLMIAPGCGGGGESAPAPVPPPTPAELLALATGTYAYVSFTGDSSIPDSASGTWGTIVMDGAGTMDGGPARRNGDGTITDLLSGPTGLPYVTATDGATDFEAGLYLGAVSPSGRFAMYTGHAVAGSPKFLFLVR